MRFVWVDAGADPDYPKAIAHGIDGFFFALDSATKLQLQLTHAAGYSVGVYMASNWAAYQGMTGPEIAEAVHADVQQLKWSTSVSTPKVQFDLEEHEPAKIAACLERWRELQPRRDTSWTLEPFQAGWMTPDFVKRVLGCRVRVVPQFYMGPSVAEPFDMRPAAGDMVLRDLTRRGFPENIVSGFYDAARVTPSSRWNGFAFTQSRLS